MKAVIVAQLHRLIVSSSIRNCSESVALFSCLRLGRYKKRAGGSGGPDTMERGTLSGGGDLTTGTYVDTHHLHRISDNCEGVNITRSCIVVTCSDMSYKQVHRD